MPQKALTPLSSCHQIEKRYLPTPELSMPDPVRSGREWRSECSSWKNPVRKVRAESLEGLRFGNYVLFQGIEVFVKIFVLKLNEISYLHRLLYL